MGKHTPAAEGEKLRASLKSLKGAEPQSYNANI
jgi:hypothetical protein